MGTEKPDQPPKGKKDKMAEHSCSLSLHVGCSRLSNTSHKKTKEHANSTPTEAHHLKRCVATSQRQCPVRAQLVRASRTNPFRTSSVSVRHGVVLSISHTLSLSCSITEDVIVHDGSAPHNGSAHANADTLRPPTGAHGNSAKKKNALDLDADCILAHAATRICCVPHGVSCAATDSSSLNSYASIACPHGLSTRVPGLTIVLQTQLEGEAQREGVFSRVCVGKMEQGGPSERGDAEWSGGGCSGGMRRTQLG